MGGCAAIGAWNVVVIRDRPGAVRFEMLVGSNLGGSVYEVNCSDLSYSQVGLTTYDQEGNLIRTIRTNTPLEDKRATSMLRQVCKISRGEAVQTFGDFATVADFRAKSSEMDPSYFAGQPSCQSLGPARIVRAN